MLPENVIKQLTNFARIERESIEDITVTLATVLEESPFQVFQAFYFPEFLTPFSISILTSAKINAAFIAAYYHADEEYTLAENVSDILRGIENYKYYYPCKNPPDLQPVEALSEVANESWCNVLTLDEELISSFMKKLSVADISRLEDIHFHGSDDFGLYQYGRYFATPHTHNLFQFSRRMVGFADETDRYHFFYFMYLLQFFKTHTTNKFAQNIITMILSYYDCI